MNNTLASIKALKAAQGRRSMNVLYVPAASVDGQTVTIGSRVYEIDTTNVAGITAGRVRVDLSPGSLVSSAAAATGTLTSDNTNVADAATVTIDAKVYTFKTALTPTEGEVLIGADADGSLLNLIRAINHTGTPDTHYKCAAAHPTVTAASAVTSHAFAVTAKTPGTAGNSIVSTETSTHLSWGAATLASGVDPTAGETVDALVAAINADNLSQVRAEKIGTNELAIASANIGINAIACTETLAGSGNVWAAATMFGGANESDMLHRFDLIKRVPTATEVTLQTMHFYFPFAPATAVVQARSSTGALKALDGNLVITGKRVSLVSSGSVDPAANDLVTVFASE